MMDDYSNKLNSLLIDTFRNVLKLEESMLKSMGDMKLSISEVHAIEAIGAEDGHPKTINRIAEMLDVSPPFVTNTVKRLESTGHVSKAKSGTDGRSVHIVLTRLGEKVDAVHRYFHKNMIKALVGDIGDNDKEVLISGLERLEKFLKGK